jgi:hypothetical protein
VGKARRGNVHVVNVGRDQRRERDVEGIGVIVARRRLATADDDDLSSYQGRRCTRHSGGSSPHISEWDP